VWMNFSSNCLPHTAFKVKRSSNGSSTVEVSFQPFTNSKLVDYCGKVASKSRFTKSFSIVSDDNVELCENTTDIMVVESQYNWAPTTWNSMEWGGKQHVWADSVFKWASNNNPRKRCIFGVDNDPFGRCDDDDAWYVEETMTCPSEADKCTLDPTCKCPDGAVKTAILGGRAFPWEYFNSTAVGANTLEIGVWCFRCDHLTHRQCPKHQNVPYVLRPGFDWLAFFNEQCTMESCDCPVGSSWPNPNIKMTYYVDSDRKFVNKTDPAARKCYGCAEPQPYNATNVFPLSRYHPWTLRAAASFHLSINKNGGSIYALRGSADLVANAH